MSSLPVLKSATLRTIEEAYRALPLMQRAGEAAAAWAMEIAVDRDDEVLIGVGPGNNGGDALDVAARLIAAGFRVRAVLPGDPEGFSGDAAAACQRFVEAGGRIETELPSTQRWRLIIDGLFGIGLARAPEGRYAECIAFLNAAAQTSACPLLALDCPSGLDADTGTVPGTAVNATHTITFIAMKPGLLTAEGPDHCGQLRLADLGIAPDAAAADGHRVDRALFKHCLAARRRNCHKGTHGSAGILGGAHSMLGAVLLAGRAALKLGAGRVYLGLLAPEAPALDYGQPELMLRRPEGLFGADLTALACGPGLGTSLQAIALLEHALHLTLPLVLDADALNLLALEGNLQTALAARQAPALLTPHPLEAARLLDADPAEIMGDRIAAACEIARMFGSHVALKGCGTIIANPDGHWWINTTGNAALATAGTGDVLTGFAVALLAQGWPMESAALGAIHLHGAAADLLVAEGRGPIGTTASEIIDPARRIFNTWH